MRNLGEWRREALFAGLLALLGLGLLPPAGALASKGLPPSSEDGSGIKVTSRKAVLFGSPRTTRTPAEVDCHAALKATPEMRKIESEDIPKGSARYQILKTKASKRLRQVIKALAVEDGRDCVIRKGSLRRNPHKLEVKDLTSRVVERLEEVEIDESV